MSFNKKRVSKFLSLVLRHNPDKIGIEVGPAGWTEVTALLRSFEENGLSLTRSELDRVVHSQGKKRFSYSEDGKYIRANYGHSIPVDLDSEPEMPPETLFHGTAARFLPGIRENGLLSRNRQFVHLSADRASATEVGQRHGRPVILRILANRMYRDGYQFFRSDARIWLTRKVPTAYIEFPE